MSDTPERLFRLRDPDEGKPLPPPGQENILSAGLFAACAATLTAVAVVRIARLGPGFALSFLGAAVYLGLLARGAWLVRPREDGERRCRRLLVPVLLQALFYAASTVYATSGADIGPAATALFGGAVLAALAGLAASFVLHGVARRARPLVLAQFLGPVLLGGGVLSGGFFL